MDNLPIEVISNIALNLEKVSIWQCMKVCRLWYSIMSPLYYETLEISPLYKKLLTLTEITRIDGKKIGDFARHIYFNYDSHLQQAEFCRLILNLPYLHSIKFMNPDSCVDFLSSIPPRHLENIQEVTADTSNKETQKTVLSINIKLKDRITRMYLNGVSPKVKVNEYNDLLTALSSFTKLTELNVRARSVQEPLYLQHILCCCSYLEELETDSGLTLAEGIHGNHRNLKILRLSAQLKNDILLKHLDYITDHLPSLKELALDDIYEENVSIFDLNSTHSKKFVDYLKVLSKFRLKIYYRAYDYAYCIQDQRFWSYIHELVSEDYSCNLTIDFSKPANCRDTTITGNACQKVIDINNSWIVNCYFSNEPWIHFVKFLHLKSVNIFLHRSSADFRGLRTTLFEPLIQVLMQQKNHPSTFSLVTNIFDGIPSRATLRFVDPEIFEYRVQKQERDNYEPQTRSRGVLDLMNILRPLLGGRMLDVSESPLLYEVEYLVEVNDCTDYSN